MKNKLPCKRLSEELIIADLKNKGISQEKRKNLVQNARVRELLETKKLARWFFKWYYPVIDKELTGHF